jgi:hypothetical protein
MESWMLDFLARHGDKIIAAALSFLAPVVIGLIGYRRLKRMGIDKSNYFLIEDNVKLRHDLFARVELVETLLAESQDRERALQVQNGHQAAEIATLRTQQEAQREDMEQMKTNHRDKMEELKKKIRELKQQLKQRVS